jgi:hypothetical protein
MSLKSPDRGRENQPNFLLLPVLLYLWHSTEITLGATFLLLVMQYHVCAETHLDEKAKAGQWRANFAPCEG